MSAAAPETPAARAALLKRSAAEALLAAAVPPAGEAPWAREARARARARLLEMGAPARRDEYWRMTDPAALIEPRALAPTGDEPARPALLVPARLAVVHAGAFRPDFSDPLDQPGLTVLPLARALTRDITAARDIFGTLEAAGHEKVARPLAALNTALASDGLVLHATRADLAPVHLHVSGGGIVRHVIRLEAGARLTLVETGCAANAVLEVDLAPGARFDHVRVQTGDRAPAAAHVFARIGAGAYLRAFTLAIDGQLGRNETVIDLAGEGAHGGIAAAVLGQGASHLDQTVFVTHSAPGCESRQVFKTVLADRARGVFQGKIFVRKDAQKTDGYQIAQSVLLTDGAEFLAKPELEIYADDVKCSHGSTTGALDETALFYLRSRGVPQAEAEAMLVAAFTEEAIGEIADEALAEHVRGLVAVWMAGRSAR